jgi:membrane protease YdiL (CAAX protease family)
MNNTTISAKTTKNVTAFFVLTFVLSTPFFLLSTFVPAMVYPSSVLLVFTPMVSALILTVRKDGWNGAKALMKRSFDFRRITRKAWYAPILLIMPIVALAVVWILGLIGDAPTETVFSPAMAPVLFLMFTIMAVGEEVGWTGYAYDPMEERWNAVWASLILGIIWGLWHVPTYLFAGGRTLLWTAGQVGTMIGLRILFGWIYNNAGKSLFAVILIHVVYNLSVTLLPVFEKPLGPVLFAILVMIIVVIIVALWDHRTWTRLRRERRSVSN